MQTIKAWYNPKSHKANNKSKISTIALFSWLSVLVVIVMFWSAIAVGFKRDYVPRAIAKVEHKERKFLASHKSLQKKLGNGTHSLI